MKRHRHPVNIEHHDRANFGERLADRIAAFIGSWRFLVIQTVLVAIWIAFNTLQVTGAWHIDIFPYVLLNLAFSTQAAYTGPVLLLAGNRQSQRDRLTLEHAAEEAERGERATDLLIREQAKQLAEIRTNTSLTNQILEQLTIQPVEIKVVDEKPAPRRRTARKATT